MFNNYIKYLENEQLWEVIVKYNGSLENISKDLNIMIEILSANYAILTLPKNNIEKLKFYKEIIYYELPRLLSFSLTNAISDSCINPTKNNPYNLTGEGTLVAIIDSGINYLHKDFRNDDGSSRILYIWDQTIDKTPHPEGFFSGTLYTKEQIDNALKTKNPLEIVPTTDDIGHGTGVCGIACGNLGVANKAGIIIVKLGEKGRKSFARNTEIMRAIKFVLDISVKLNKPIAINISFGTNEGSHTGNSLFETYIDEMATNFKTSICVAMGNEGSASHHYEGVAVNNKENIIEMQVSEELSSLNIVLYKHFSDLFNIKIISPSGEESPFINYRDNVLVYNFSQYTLRINLNQPTPYSIEEGIFLEISGKNQQLATGIWKIIILGQNIVSGRFDIWLPITEKSSLNTKFLNPTITTTLTIPATASKVVSVGGYNNLTNSIAEFSGRGYTRNLEIKPDIVAPAVNIKTTSNFLGYNTYSGTSFATPFATGACALLMEWGIVKQNDIFLYGERLKAFLRLGAKKKGNIVYPNEEWGFGSLCVFESLKFLEMFKNDNFIRKVNTMANNNENYFSSDDYFSVLAQYNPYTISEIEKNDYIKLCKVVSGNFAVLYIKKDMLPNVIKNSSKMLLQIPFILGTMNKNALEASEILKVQNQPFLNLKGSGVLVGIVDTGVNYTVEELKYEDNTTKIVSIWDQNINGKAPKGYCFGTEFLKEDINDALASKEPFNRVPSNDEIGHGTNLATICAGKNSPEKDFVGVAPDSELVVVKLRQARKNLKEFYYISQDKVAYDSSDLILAVEYLKEKAQELNKPIAICIALGTNFGSHNGFSILEQFLTNISLINGVAVCVCTGNEGNKQHHSLLKLSEVEKEKTFEIKVDEKERGFLLNMSTFPTDTIGINIISPDGNSSGKIPPRNNYDEEIFFPLNNTRVRVQHFLNPYQSIGQLALLTFKNPSPGIWKVNVYGENILIGDVHCWLPISEFLQSGTNFLNSDPFYTATVPSTANSVISVGGYDSFNNSLYVESGRGPTRLNSLKPIICAPAVNVSSVGNTSNLEAFTGTSAATAIVVGCAALILEWGIVKGNNPIINSTTIIGALANGSKKMLNEPIPNNSWGFGILDLLKTFEKM